jgi:O-antigen/teichoic acid export membrane protein
MQKLSSNLVYVIGGEMLLRLAGFAVAVLVGRVYGAVVLGVYAAILAVATLAERLADNGLETSGIAIVSAHPENLNRIGTSLYINKTVLSTMAIGILAGFGWISGMSRASWVIATILTLRTFLYSYCRLNSGLLKALGRSPQIAKIQFVHFVMLCGIISYAFTKVNNLSFLLLCLLVAQLTEFLLSLFMLRHYGARVTQVSLRLCWDLAKRSTPIGLTYTVSTLMLRADVLVLSVLASASVLGTFSAADTGLIMVYVIAWLFSGVLLADLGAVAANKAELDSHFRKCISVILRFCLPVTVAATVFAPSFIRLLYGRQFSSAGAPAAIAALAIPFILLNAAFLSRAVARNSASTCLAVYSMGAVFSLLLNFLLGWRYGAMGIAISIVLREIAMTVAFLGWKKIPWSNATATESVDTNTNLVELLNA